MIIVKDNLKLQKEERSGIYFEFGISVESIEPESAHEPSSQVCIKEFAGSGSKSSL